MLNDWSDRPDDPRGGVLVYLFALACAVLAVSVVVNVARFGWAAFLM